ncbi:MAG: AmmeMemoRadiSam system protein B [bacterium]
MLLRQPVVAGRFYEENPEDLKKELKNFLSYKGEKKSALGIMVPHAGYIYSGAVAGAVYSAVKLPDTFIILCPNHTGLGYPISLMSAGTWRTPLGDVKINGDIAGEILVRAEALNAKLIIDDYKAHMHEHAIEVQLPFLQVLKKEFTFVPIAFAEYDIAALKKTAECIADAIKGKQVMLISSTDLTHYESAEAAREKDKLVLDAIETLNSGAMLNAVERQRISMCGWMGTYVLLEVCKTLGAKKGEIIKYANSGEASGDMDKVVGYGGAIII